MKITWLLLYWNSPFNTMGVKSVWETMVSCNSLNEWKEEEGWDPSSQRMPFSAGIEIEFLLTGSIRHCDDSWYCTCPASTVGGEKANLKKILNSIRLQLQILHRQHLNPSEAREHWRSLSPTCSTLLVEYNEHLRLRELFKDESVSTASI